MKKKLLFVIPSLDAGGAEKSLVNLLNTIDLNRFDVDLFTFKENGFFDELVPKEVNRLPLPTNLVHFQKGLIASFLSFLFTFQIKLAIARVLYALIIYNNKNTAIAEQKNWKYLQKAIGKFPFKYHVAIGYLEKASIYCIVDNVDAINKIGFIHTNYSKSGLDTSFDECYFSKLSHLISISEECITDLKSNFPDLKNRIKLIYNIVSPSFIKKLANEGINDWVEKNDSKLFKILTVSRLSTEKNIQLAVEVARVLKENQFNFKWLVIGDGDLRTHLEKKIADYKLVDQFKLIGLKENPYPYLLATDLYLQPSLYEGKSIAIDEAKILHKPIVVTNFSTAKDQIEHQKTGLICSYDPVEIAKTIQEIKNNTELRDALISNLNALNLSTETEIEKLYKIIA